MEVATLGRTGLQVSRLGAGLYEIGLVADASAAGRVLNAALYGGIDFLDTAACYDRSEEWIGRTIAHRRSSPSSAAAGTRCRLPGKAEIAVGANSRRRMVTVLEAGRGGAVPRRVWQLDLDGEQHTVELRHGQLSGRRVIRVDGELVCRSAKSEDALSAAPTEDCFRIGDHECYLLIRPSISGATLIALATMAVLASNRPGMYDASALLGFALLMLSCALADRASWDATQGRLRPGPGSSLMPLLGVVQTLVAGALALHEAKDVRLDSWFGRLYYLGTYGHYRDLYRLAHQRHLEAVGPGPETEFGVWVRGTWHDRYIGIASDNRGLLVQVSSEIKLWPLLLVSGRRARKSGTGEGLWVTIPDGRARGKQLYLHPPDGQEPGPEAIEALRGAVLSGQRFLKSRAQIWTDEATVVFHWPRIVFGRWKTEEVVGILDWLARIAETMEALGMTDCTADGAEATGESTDLE